MPISSLIFLKKRPRHPVVGFAAGTGEGGFEGGRWIAAAFFYIGHLHFERPAVISHWAKSVTASAPPGTPVHHPKARFARSAEISNSM